MYSLSSIKTALGQPRMAIAELNRMFHQGLDVRSGPVNDEGIDVLSQDWDTLIILDACRFDTFEECGSELPGELTRVESRASATTQFLRANVSDRELHDTVYVTANPQLYRIQDGTDGADPINVSFHDQIEVWQNHWHDEHGTVMPEPMTEAVREAREQYPNKRLIVHYLQPHAPYVGPTGIEELPTEYTNFWGAYRRGEADVSLETAIEAYRENLELVVPYVDELLSELEGKTVVTADHGELLGERDSPIPIRRFGHPAHTDMPGLIEVPWLVHTSEPRPEIYADDPEGNGAEDEVDFSTVEERLQDLGYT